MIVYTEFKNKLLNIVEIFDTINILKIQFHFQILDMI